MAELSQHLTLLRGSALMLNIVLGAGVLILPGLAVREAGDLAFLTWIVCAIAALPLLGIFVVLGRRFPSAGGLAHFAGQAFGRLGYLIGSFVFMGAVLLGLPAIALSGGHYAASFAGGSPHLFAVILLVLAAGTNLISAQAAGRIGGAVGLIVAIVLLSIAGLTVSGFGATAPVHPERLLLAPTGVSAVFAPFMMIFFAFTGWEVAANLSEEFRKPSRDFPIAMLGSFAVATGLYLVLAYAAQTNDLAGAYEAPFARIFADRFGLLGGAAIAAAAVFIIYANLAAALWAVSRLVFSLAREGVLPRVLQHTRSGTPLAAVQCTFTTLLVMVLAEAAAILSIAEMLALAGQNFLLLYGLAAGALFLLSEQLGERALAVLAGAVILILLGLASGIELLYPAAIVSIAVALWLRQRPSLSAAIHSTPAE
jgi:amino acid efflux transporter